MKTIFLLRHAEAASHSGSDRDRPLTDKGRADAKRLGDAMREKGLVPTAILCSPARRTRETLEGLAFDGISVVFSEAFYNAPPENLLNALCHVDEVCESVLLIAHNPSIPTLAAALAGSGNSAALMRLNANYAPAMLSVLECPIDQWIMLQDSDCHLTGILTP